MTVTCFELWHGGVLIARSHEVTTINEWADAYASILNLDNGLAVGLPSDYLGHPCPVCLSTVCVDGWHD